MTPAEKRLAAAMRDSSASTMVKLALADYQRLLASTQTAPVDDRLAVIKAENAKLFARIDDLERKLRAVAKREEELHQDRPQRERPQRVRAVAPDRSNTRWAGENLFAAVAKVNADPDRSFEKQGCWLAVASLLGKPVRNAKDAAKKRGLDVYPRPRREVPCTGCGGRVIERWTQSADLICGTCQARRYRSYPMTMAGLDV